MTLYHCTHCHRINAPLPPESQLILCWTCSGPVVVVDDELPFNNIKTMKALSVKNPFAGLIAHGLKRYEVRTFKTKYRGPLVICSSKKPVRELYEYYKSFSFGLDLYEAIEVFKIDGMPNGSALCVVDLVDVIPYEGTEEQQRVSYTELDALHEYFGEKPYYLWKLKNARLIDPVPVKGQLGIFNLDIEVDFI